jgi:hypothetical protein
MPPRQIRQRLTGVSTPLGGISWETRQDVDHEVLTRLIAFLEDRRVLYNPTEVEVVEHCVSSVLDIRRYLVTEVGRLPGDGDIATALRNMAAACRRFLDRVPHGREHRPLGPLIGSGYESWVFNQALGELRGQIGIYLGGLVQSHGLKLSDPLATILPPPPEPDPID